jgi:predicted CxxxxCH...CXXCH cytochrome family protein
MTNCAQCHGEVVAPDNISMVDRTRHINGQLDVMFSQECNSCHGSTNPAPPKSISGSTDTSTEGVGAHQTHVLGTARSRAVLCSECHVVPTTVFDVGHFDTALPAELTFSGVAVAWGAAPAFSNGSCQNTYCHGQVFPQGYNSGGSNTAPAWTTVDGTQAACGTCHSLPPPAPHPVVALNPVCNACHKDIAPDNTTFLAPERHVDGVVTFDLPLAAVAKSQTSCCAE